MKKQLCVTCGLLLALCALVMPAYAQNTVVPYSFTYTDGNNASRNFIFKQTDDNSESPDISLRCMAANGYGIWTSSTTEGNPGWFLLANEQSDQKTEFASYPQGPGVVGNGAWANNNELSSQVKVAANTFGRVRYVYLNTARDAFIVEGLNDQQHFPEAATTKQIDIDYADLGSSLNNTAVDIDEIHVNYWGGVNPMTSTNEFPQTTYTCASKLDDPETFDVACGDGFELLAGKGKRAQSHRRNSEPTCSRWLTIGEGLVDYGEYQAGYDTLKMMIETCAPDNYWKFSQLGFLPMGDAVIYMSMDANRFHDHREWLKSVLYLNTINPLYYCKATAGISRTYNWTAPNGGRDINAMVTIARYILASGKCDFERHNWVITDSSLRAVQKYEWLQTHETTDGLDTTLPTIEDLDLSILYGPFGSVGSASKIAMGSLTNVHVSRNPFTSMTEIEYTLSGLAQVELSLFNSLGQEIWKQEAGGVLDEGTHRLTVDGKSLPTGTLYLRVSTIGGDVKTVKLIHE